jgi:hypothetical protein
LAHGQKKGGERIHMHMRYLVIAVLTMLVAGTGPMALARESATATPKTKTPLETLHAMKKPIVPGSAEVVRGETIEIELTDANHQTLIVDVGGERRPGTMLEMFRGAPRDDVVLKSKRSEEGDPLEKGSSDEKQILKIMEEWRESTHATTPRKPGKKGADAAPTPNEASGKLVDRIIALLKPRHPAPQPLSHSTH